MVTQDKKTHADSQPRLLLEDKKAALLTIVDLLKNKKKFFYLTFCLTLLGTLLGHFLQVPSYKATATLFVKNNESTSAAELFLNRSMYQSTQDERIESYTNHLNSDSFLMKVAEKIKFEKKYNNLNLVSPHQKSKLSLSYWKNQIINAQHKENMDADERLLIPVQSLIGFLRKTTKYNTQFGSQFIAIEVSTLDPSTSQMVANLIAEEFVAITNKHSLNEVEEIENFVNLKKGDSEKKVRELDKKLIAFKQKNNIISEETQTRNFADRLSNLDQQIESAQLKKEEFIKILADITKGRKLALSQIIKNGSRNTDFASAETSLLLQNKIDQLKREKSAYLAQGFNETSWQIQKINLEIDKTVRRLGDLLNDPGKTYASLDPQIAEKKMNELKSSIRDAKARIKTLEVARASLQGQVTQLPNLQQEYIQLKNQFKIELETLANLERKEKELEIQRISYKKEVRVDQLAETPGATPTGSLTFKLLFSTLAALFLGILIILGLESIDPSVKSRDDLVDCGLEFFGEIPFANTPENTDKKKKKVNFGRPQDLICKTKPESIESMSFKYMRARIESMKYKDQKECHIISVSSALHDEGKSFVSANLAISLTGLRRKVLLIDADLRRPSQPSYFNLSVQHGLVDILTMESELETVIIKDEQTQLDILPAGYFRNDSTELISSQKFRILINHLKTKYEYIVIDTPPTFAVVDAAIITSFSDIPILVSSYRESRKADLYEAYNDLLQVSYKNVYGIINKARVSNSRIHYYGYPSLDNRTVTEAVPYSTAMDNDAEAFKKKLNDKKSS